MAGESKITGPDLGSEGIPVARLEPGIPMTGRFEGKPVLVVSTGDGVMAAAASCSHYGGPLGEGLCVEGQIRCPWHHAAFDLETGEAIGAPALNPIQVYDTTVRGGHVFVTAPKNRAEARGTPPVSPGPVVILGSGAAGAAAAEALRRYGFEGEVTLIGFEPPVDRPNLSKDYLAGTAPEEWIPLRSRQFYEDKGIELMAGETVTGIDRADRLVSFEGGRQLGYAALLIATGAEPRRLPVPGGDLLHVHCLRTFEDTQRIIAALDGVAEAAVVGAGFIGLEVAASLRNRDIGVTVVAPEEIPLTHAVGETLGRFVADLHRERGVSLRLGREVVEVLPEGVVLDDGSQVDSDLVIVGIGVVPRTGLAEAAGLTVDDGIVVDDRLRTSDPHIWAAGDVARYPGPEGELVRVEHWVVAERQGQAAARNILGHDAPFREPPFFWSQHYDVRINLTGHVAGWDEEVVSGNPYDLDALVGFVRAGEIRAVASIRRDRDNLRAERALARGDQRELAALLGMR